MTLTTGKKYFDYITEWLNTSNSRLPYVNTNFKSYELLAHYWKANEKCLNRMWKACKDSLVEMGVLSLCNRSWSPQIKRCQTFNLNIEKYIEIALDNNIELPREIKKYYDLKQSYNGNKEELYDILNQRDTTSNLYKMYQSYTEILTDDVLPIYNNKLIDKVRFGRVNIANVSDDEIKAAIYAKYPQLGHYVAQANLMNLNHNNYQYDFYEITIKRGKKGNVSKIGTRITNRFCSLPTTTKKVTHNGYETNEYHPYEGSREQFLDKTFGKNNWYEYDVKGSIPTLARAINKGIIKDLSVDTYKECYSSCFTEWNKTTRDLAKKYSMRMIFGGSVANICCKLTHKYGADSYQRDFIEKMKQCEEDYCGNPNGDTSIFMHESNIYNDVKLALETKGIEVYQCYDGFYISKSNRDIDIQSIIADCIKTYINNLPR